jgi:hypothetical protein
MRVAATRSWRRSVREAAGAAGTLQANDPKRLKELLGVAKATKNSGKPGAETICRKPACAAGAATIGSRCDGKGVCVDEAPAPCSPYTCDPKGEACLTACAAPSDCAAGFTCSAGKCIAVGGRCSDDGLSAIDSEGKVSDCAGRKCKGGKCVEICNGSDDCAPTYLCNAGACVPPVPPTDDGGGCAWTGGSAGTGPGIGLWLGALALLGTARRRRAPRPEGLRERGAP